MQLAMIGLGRMGASMVSRLLAGGHQCTVFDTKPTAVDALVKEGARGATSVESQTESSTTRKKSGASPIGSRVALSSSPFHSRAANRAPSRCVSASGIAGPPWVRVVLAPWDSKNGPSTASTNAATFSPLP